MAKGDFWFKFEWNAWLGDDSLSLCSLETQGFWVRCIAIMNRSDVSELTGTKSQLCRQIGCLPDELDRSCNELKNTNSADVIFCNDNVIISSRRRKRELNHNEANRLAVARHREKSQCNADVIGQSKSKSKSKNKEIDKSSIEDSSINQRWIRKTIDANPEKDKRLVEVAVIQTLINRNGSIGEIKSVKYFDPEIERMTGTSENVLKNILPTRRKQLQQWQKTRK